MFWMIFNFQTRSNLSMKKKRFVISMNPAEFLEQVLNS